MVRFGRPGEGPKEASKKMVTALNNIDGIFTASIEETNGHFMIEWHMPDQDPKFPSVVSLMVGKPEIEEATIRMGPLGHREEVPDGEIRDIEGRWVDTVLDAASDTGMLEHLDGNDIDLGDAYISPLIRPHVRFYYKDGGYDIDLGNFVDFVESLAGRFESKYGTLEDRKMDPKLSQRYKDKR
jgi:hypothetical protein